MAQQQVLRLPDEAVYKPGTKDGRQAAAKAAGHKLAELGAAVVKEQLVREELAKELDAAADRWKAKADSISPRTSEVAHYYYTKSRSAREKAAAIRRGEALK